MDRGSTSSIQGALPLSSAPSSETDNTTVTVFGHQLHVSFTRPYVVPPNIDWGAKSLARRWAFLYEDSDVAAQFRAFFFRNLTSATTGFLYGGGTIVFASVNIAYGFREARFVSGAVTVLMTYADLFIHTTRPVTPFWGTVRHCLAIGMVAALVPGSSVNLFQIDTHCDKVLNVPDTTALGRRDFSNTDISTVCVLGIQQYGVSAVTCATIGLMLHPMSHGVAILGYTLLIYLGRLLDVDRAEAPRDLIPKIVVSCVIGVATFAISAFRCLGAMDAFEQTLRVEAQRREAAGRAAEIGALLSTVVPEAVLPRLAAGGDAQFTVDTVECATVLFADMREFTAWASPRTAREVTTMLCTVVDDLDRLEQSVRGVNKVKTIGDAYWAVAGIPVEAEDHADQMVFFAHGMAAVVARTAEQNPQWGALQWRIGVHSGPLSGALFGAQQVSYEVFGPTARATEQVEVHGVPGAVCVTSQTLDSLLVRPDTALLQYSGSFQMSDQSDGTTTIEVFTLAHDVAVNSVRSRTSSFTGGNDMSLRSDPDGFAAGFAAVAVPDHGMAAPRGNVLALSSCEGSTPPLSSRHAGTPLHSLLLRSSPGTRAACLPTNGLHRSAHVSVRCTAGSDGGALGAAHGAEFDAAAASELSARRWRLLPWFRDTAAETRFKELCETSTRGIHRAMALGCVCFAVTVMLAGFVQTDPCWSPVGFSLQMAGLLLSIASFAVTLFPTVPLSLVAPLLTAGSILATVGTGVSSRDGCNLGHGVVFYYCATGIMVSFCVGPVSWPLLSGSVVFLSTPPMYVLQWLHSPDLLHTVAAVPVLFIYMFLNAIMTESTLRWRSVEAELSTRAESHLATLSDERALLLRRLVPGHVVSDLVAWFGTGMDPAAAIVREYDEVVIGFVHLLAPADLLSPSESLPAAPNAAWLPRAHAVVDEDIARCAAAQHRHRFGTTAVSDESDVLSPALDKIKTVGDIVMLAGPFVGGFSTLDAADAALAIAALLAGRTTVRVGLHVGPVVGTVQGLTRLAFDTFGDAVNVASRVMGSAGSGDVHCSTAFVERLSSTNSSATPALELCGSLRFGEAMSVAAKGKGYIGVHRLEALPTLAL